MINQVGENASVAVSDAAIPDPLEPGGGRLRDCLVIIITSVLLSLLLRPFQNIPLIDDWVWAWPVEHLMKTGQVASLEYGGNHVIFTQVFWGALFCIPAGFSLSALRVSTWVLAVIGLCLLYLTLRDQKVSRRDSLIGVAIVGFNPMFFVLQYSFMTDVPFLTFLVATVFTLQRAVQRRSDGWLVTSVLLASAAGGIRSVGAALPLAAFLVLLFHSGRWGRHPLRLLASLVPLAALYAMFVWRERVSVAFADLSGSGLAPENARQNMLTYAIPELPISTVATVGTLVVTVGLALLPISLAWVRRCRWTILAGALVLLLVAWWRLPGSFHCLPSGSTWQWNELGGLQLPNRPKHHPPLWLDVAMSILAVVSSGVLLSLGARKSAVRPAAAWLMLGFCGLIAILWLFYDRYGLPLIPLALLLLLPGRSIPYPRLAIAATVLLAVISLIGLRDNLLVDAAKMRAFEMLRGRGIAIPDIDAGYSINGWLQYGHPENIRMDEEGKPQVVDLTTSSPPRFQASFRPMPGGVVIDTVPYRRWMGPSGAIYLLEYPSNPLQRPKAEKYGPAQPPPPAARDRSYP